MAHAPTKCPQAQPCRTARELLSLLQQYPGGLTRAVMLTHLLSARGSSREQQRSGMQEPADTRRRADQGRSKATPGDPYTSLKQALDGRWQQEPHRVVCLRATLQAVRRLPGCAGAQGPGG
jgi:hypothetical protein